MNDRLPDSLADWLEHIERQHPVEIDMGLERVRQVHGRLGLRCDIDTAIAVAGTNGKGSCVAYLESIYEAAGFRSGAYTSPHLQKFNERIRIGGQPVSDAEIVAAFRSIEAARMDVTLTYFEYSTLAALFLFDAKQVDVHVLEVGLGGRLDAVNVINAAVAIIASIGLDHQDWLGDDREAIAVEKAGVLRRNQPALVGDSDPPQSIASVAAGTGARLLQIGRDFGFERKPRVWDWHGCIMRFEELPYPRFGGAEQLANASCALAAIEQLAGRLRIDRRHIVEGLRRAQLPGRYQQISGKRNWILDVAHNGDAARALASSLDGFDGQTVAVIGMIGNKPVEALGEALCDAVDEWIVVSDGQPGSMAVADLSRRLESCVRAPVRRATSVPAGLAAAAEISSTADRILVTGSFRVVGPALAYLSQHA